MSLKTLKMLAALAVSAAVVGCGAGLYMLSAGNRGIVILKVYTAGSLAEPFGNMPEGNDLETFFEESHQGVDVQVTSGGSVDIIRRITDLHQTCDVLAVADYSLIPSMMINATPKMADFCIQFAKNSMVIAYTGRSAHHEELTSGNWFNILRLPDVKFGFSNPNDDPAGYRAQMLMLLAQMHYGVPNIYESLVLNNTNMLGVICDEENGTYTVEVPSVLTVTNTDKLMIRSAEVDLTSALESGSIDYLFIYESVALRHASSGVRYLELPSQINLNDTAFASLYSKVRVKLFADSSNVTRIKIVEGSPIVYGVTIPSTSRHPDIASEFMAMLLGETGQSVMRGAGQEPIVPARAGYWEPEVPDILQRLVV